MVQSTTRNNMSDVKTNAEEALFDSQEEAGLDSTQMDDPRNLPSWHIPRPSLVARSDKSSSEKNSEGSSDKSSDNGTWKHHPDSPSRGSTASTHSAASGTLLLTAANLANLAAMHPSRVTAAKDHETASVASSTHFTVVNGLGRPNQTCRKSWCARNQLTVLVCTMSFLFMLGLLAGVLYMEMRARGRYN